MFENYKTQLGDTPLIVARKELGDPIKANDIIRINNLFPIETLPLMPGITIKIPVSQPQPDDLSNSIKFETDTGRLNSLSLTIGNNNLELFDDFQYMEPLAGIRAGAFVCDYDPIKNIAQRESFKFGKTFKMIANNEKMLTGYTMTPMPVYSLEFKGITMMFKSAIHTMLRSDIAPNNFPLEFTAGQTLGQIASKICSMFNIKLIIDETVSNIIFDDGDGSGVSIGVIENAFAFLIRICQSRGVIIRDNADGGLVIFRPQRKPSMEAFIAETTEGIESIAVSYNYEILAKNYNLFSQYGDNAVFGSAENKILPLNIYKNIDVSSVSQGLAGEIAKWRMLRELGNAIKITVPIEDWYTSDGKRYQAGEFIDIKSPFNGIFERHQFIIETVTFSLSNDNYGGSLLCTIPEAYTGETVEYLPMI